MTPVETSIALTCPAEVEVVKRKSQLVAGLVLGLISEQECALSAALEALRRIRYLLVTESSGQPLAEQPPGPTPMRQEGTHPERLLAFMRQRPGMVATRKELIAAFPEVSANTFGATMARLKDRGEVEAVRRGRYRVIITWPHRP
jgi:hypothetical protein